MTTHRLSGFLVVSISDPIGRAILQATLRSMIEEELGPSLDLDVVRNLIANAEIPEETKTSLLDANERLKNYVWYQVVAETSVGCPFKPNELIAVVHPTAGEGLALAGYFSTSQRTVMPVAYIKWADIARQPKQ